MIEERDLEDAKEELKRADHLIYVSLKYTRTGDVLISIIVRLINAQELIFDELLRWLEKEKKLKNVDFSKPYRIKLGWIGDALKRDANVKELIEFHELLTKIIRSEHKAINEFRKHLTLIAMGKKGEVIAEVTFDVIKEYYKKTESLIEKVERVMK